MTPPSDVFVVAIIAAYNEADIIDQVVRDLIEQGVHVYVMDDGSTDATAAVVERYLGRGVLGIERCRDRREAGTAGGFEWERILLRKAELAHELDASWFIHHDADEFRESPWPHLPLAAAIRAVDALGFNAIDFARLDFWPVHDRFRSGDDVRDAFTFYAPPAPWDRMQIRCWKKTGTLVDLASTGGHEVRFPGRKVCPLRFILRHYPIRGQAHGERKVFRERRARFIGRERARGWHVQYDDVQEGTSFIRDPSTLTAYDPDAVRLAVMLRHRDVEDLEATLAATRDELAAQKDDVERSSNEIARIRAELDARSAEVARLRADLETRMRDIADRAAEVKRLRNAVDQGARRLEEVYRSLSWRWMAPARAVSRLLRWR